MKKLVNLKGVKTLNRTQQKEIFGGDPVPHGDGNGGAGGGGGTCVSCTPGGGECAPSGQCSLCDTDTMTCVDA